ncbi:MAG TPA: hypothetical protein VJT08_07395 [Terriglobales bacterium]|nr:hypothetical protein [Acidobacteriaceae bacterium]HKR30284.1 hypothetical protein [Terriglobales bacterium]
MKSTENSLSLDQSEHRYFSIVALAVTVTVLAGFVPLYTIRLLRHDPNLTLLVHAHGFVMEAWIALFLTQTLLIAKHRIDIHRKLGMFGAGLALLVLVVSVPTLINAAARRSHHLHTRLLWMLAAFDGIALVVFAGLVGAAILMRRRGDYHKRLMLLATLSLLGPAFGRLTEYAKGFHGISEIGVLLLCAETVVVCALVDMARSRRLHPAFVWGGITVIGMDVATFVAQTML